MPTEYFLQSLSLVMTRPCITLSVATPPRLLEQKSESLSLRVLSLHALVKLSYLSTLIFTPRCWLKEWNNTKRTYGSSIPAGQAESTAWVRE